MLRFSACDYDDQLNPIPEVHFLFVYTEKKDQENSNIVYGFKS